MRTKHRGLTVVACLLGALLLALISAPVALADQYVPAKTVAAGSTWLVTDTTRLNVLVIEAGGAIVAPEGHSVTLTVDGVEMGQVLATTAGVDTVFAPGAYFGNIVLTVSKANIVDYAPAGPPDTPHVYFPFRQAIYVDAKGLDRSRSVLAAVSGGAAKDTVAKNVRIRSTGECFNGIFVAGGSYLVDGADINLVGNGRSDFAGYGVAVMATGEGTNLVVNNANIVTRGVARSAVVATGGSNVVVKNSHIETYNGVLPADYVPTIDTAQMRSVPWMLGLSGNVRSTNLLGTNTKASYINSYIASEGWGVLSTDGCTTPTLTAINSTIAILGEDGYGSYGIGDATEYFLGCTFDVGTYSTISRGSYLYYGDSTPERVAQLNEQLGLGLSAAELARIPSKPTVVQSDRFGVMWHGGGTLEITGGTVFNTRETTFLDKGQAISIVVDGSQGAALNPGNGVIMQVMDDDDPGPEFPAMTNTGTYTEPTGPVEPDPTHDPYAAGSSDAVAVFSNISLKGDFYNSTRGGLVQGPFGPPSSVSRNLGLTFDNADITGVISASTATHAISTITAADYKYLGEVTNTPSPAVNNGVIVNLKNGSTWTVTGTCYLTSLTIGPGCKIDAPQGYGVRMTVNGVPRLFRPGTYTGQIVLTVSPLKAVGPVSR